MNSSTVLETLEIQLKETDGLRNECGDKDWTKKIIDVLDRVADRLEFNASRHGPKFKNHEHAEYLAIDCMFFDRRDEGQWVLPTVTIEHENSDLFEKIEYCLWKVLCVRCETQVLICYQTDKNKRTELAENLKRVVWENQLMKGNNAHLFVLIGIRNNNIWDGEYMVYEWRNDDLDMAGSIKCM